jgi:phosphopantothenoylcysteine decarboxylase/phosphopantothenate--cysteine ligase
VISAQEMRDEVAREIRDATIFIAAAAVADYRPKVPSNAKIKKSQTELTLDLERTPDILSEAARTRREGQLIIGFAAETNDVFENARKKMRAKRLDMIIANDVSVQGQGFDAENNRVTILRPDAAPLELPLMSKLEVADRVLDQIASLRQTTSQSLRLTKTN